MHTKTITIGLAMVLGLTGALQAQTIWWTGAGDGTSWHDPANWNTEVVPGDADTVYLGYDDDGTVPDVPQAITLTAPATNRTVVIAAVGNRQVTVSGEDLTLTGSTSVEIADTAASTTVFEANVGINRRNDFWHTSSTQDVVLAGNIFRPPADFGTGAYEWRYYGNENRLRLQGTGYLQIDHRTGGVIVSETDGQSISRIEASDSGLEFHLAASPVLGTVRVSTASYGIRRVGTGDRRTGGSNMDLSGGATSTLVLLPADDPEQGHLTVVVHRFGSGEESSNQDRGDGPSVLTSTNSTVEIGQHGVSRRQLMNWAPTPGITGPGRMRLNMSSASSTFLVRRTLEHTGGTVLDQGILVIDSVFVAADNTTYYGQLPTNGLVRVGEDATLRLNADHAPSIGRLGGVGPVQLRTTTLTLNNGFAPGMSVGELVIEDEGAVVLKGTSVFEFADTETYDTVRFTDGADLTLGGTLEVIAPEGFVDVGVGSYPIMQLNGGTVVGTFDAIIPPEGMEGAIEVVDNDVLLVLTRAPTGTILLIR